MEEQSSCLFRDAEGIRCWCNALIHRYYPEINYAVREIKFKPLRAWYGLAYYHQKKIELSKDWWSMSDERRARLLAHEVGHLIADYLLRGDSLISLAPRKKANHGVGWKAVMRTLGYPEEGDKYHQRAASRKDK